MANGASALSQAARGAEGVPQNLPQDAGGASDVGALMELLRSGQFSAESLLQLLALLSGIGGQGLGLEGAAPPGEGASPVEAAFLGG